MSPHQDKVTQEINTAQQIMDAIPPVAEEFKKNGSFEVLPLFLFRGPEGSALKIVFESTNDDGRFAKKQADEIVEKLNESLQKHRVPAEADTRYAREQILNRDGTEAGAKYHDIYRHRRLERTLKIARLFDESAVGKVFTRAGLPPISNFLPKIENRYYIEICPKALK